MALKNVLPSLIGQPRSARRTDRPVGMPNGLGDIARGLGELGGTGMRLAGDLADLRREEEELGYRETLNAAIAEADKRMNEEVFSQNGFGVSGSVDRAGRIYSETMEKYVSGLSGKNARRFAEAFTSRRNASTRSIMAWERREVGNARIQANGALIKSEGERFRASLDPSAVENIRKAWEDNIRLSQGRVITPSSYSEFVKDVEDGDGFVKLPGGRRLRIGESDGDGVISRARVQQIKEQFRIQSEAYEAGWRNICGSLHGGVIDLYLKDGRISEAERYLEQIRGTDNDISEATRKEAQRLIGLKRESIELTRGAQAFVTKRMGKSSYFSNEAESACLEHMQELEDAVSKDESGKALKRLDAFRQVFSASRAAARQKLATDTRAVIDSFREGGDLSTAAGVASIPSKLAKADPVLRRSVLNELAPVIMKFSSSRASKEASEARSGYLAACWARGCVYDKDGTAIPLGSGQQAKQAFTAFCAANGVTPQEAERIIRSTENGKLSYMEASTDVSKFINDLIGSKVTDPEALNGLEAQSRFGSLIRQYNQLLLRYAEKGKEIPETVRRGVFFEMLRNQVRDGKPLSDWVTSNIKDLRSGEMSLSEFYKRTATEEEMRAWNRVLRQIGRSAAGVPSVTELDDTAQAATFTGDVRDPETGEYVQADELESRTREREERAKRKAERDAEGAKWNSPSYRVMRTGGLW